MMNQVTGLLQALADVAWPVIAGVLVWKLYPILVQRAKSGAVKVVVAGFELTLQEVSDNVRRDITDLQQKLSELRTEHRASAPAAARPSRSARPRRPPSILWVDDEPENNAFEIARLKEKGITITQVRSTAEALQAHGRTGDTVGIIVSDMGRQEANRYNEQAGIELLQSIRQRDKETPVLFYTGPRAVQPLKGVVEASGGQGITGSAVELAEMIDKELAGDVPLR